MRGFTRLAIGLANGSAIGSKRPRMIAQSRSESGQRVRIEQASRSSGMPPFVHAYMRSWVYDQPWMGVIVAVLTKKSVG
jgi:hypothetical protein